MNREEIHNFLDKKKVRELPQKFNIEEEPSLFDENSNSFESDSKNICNISTNQKKILQR